VDPDSAGFSHSRITAMEPLYLVQFCAVFTENYDHFI